MFYRFMIVYIQIYLLLIMKKENIVDTIHILWIYINIKNKLIFIVIIIIISIFSSF